MAIVFCYGFFTLLVGLLSTPPVVETATTTPTTEEAGISQSCSSTDGGCRVEVSASTGWQSQRVSITKGQSVRITHISGTWSPWPEADFYPYYKDSDYNGGPFFPSAGFHALIGKIGNYSPPFLVDEIEQTIVAEESGMLYFRINDDDTNDNSGSIIVQIDVQSQSTGFTSQSTVVTRTPTKTATKTSTSVPTKTATKTSTPVPICDSANNCYEVEISAKTMWLGTKVQATKGDRIVIEYVSGKWRAGSDYSLTWTDANGYPGTRPTDYCSWCTAPILEGTLGQLVAKITEQKAVHTIGKSGEFVAEANGILCLMMNDLYYSFDDNSGSVIVRIYVNP